MMQEQCESAANLLLNDLRQRTDEYYQCSTQLDVQQQFVLTVSSLIHSTACFDPSQLTFTMSEPLEKRLLNASN